MAPAHLDRLDDAVGTGLERLVRAHHRRRLRRHGWARAYDPPLDGSLWCVGDPPPRAGNTVETLVDGELALGRLAADITAATESVHLAGWHFDPGFHLVRCGLPLRALLAEAAERVDLRLLAWAGAPLPLFSPSRSTVREQREELVRGTRIRMALDSLERPMHSHHEKLAVIDGRVAYVGGFDLTGPRRRPPRPERAPAAAGHRLARRRASDRRPAGRGRRGTFRAPLARGHRGAPRRRKQTLASWGHGGAVRPHRPERRLRRTPARRLPDPRVVRSRPPLRREARLPGEPVPLVVGARRDPRGEAAAPAE